jgi:hypothetical protein
MPQKIQNEEINASIGKSFPGDLIIFQARFNQRFAGSSRELVSPRSIPQGMPFGKPLHALR